MHRGYNNLEQHVNAMDAALVRDCPVEMASDSERRVHTLLAKAKKLRVSGSPTIASSPITYSNELRRAAIQQRHCTKCWKL